MLMDGLTKGALMLVLGAVFVPLFTGFGPDAIRHRLGASGTRAVEGDDFGASACRVAAQVTGVSIDVTVYKRLERMRAAYSHAIARGYRFFSYGDACLIEPEAAP